MAVAQALHDQILRMLYFAVIDLYKGFRQTVSVHEASSYIEALVLVQARLLNNIKQRSNHSALNEMTLNDNLMDVLHDLITAKNWDQIPMHERNFNECAVCDSLASVPIQL